MYTYSSLENTSDEVLYQAFLDAFEDYPVTVNATLSLFQNMLQRRGYNPQISLGAFNKSDNALAGFVLNGYRMWGEKRTAYDILTGTVPLYRRQGITSTILEELKELLKQKNAEQYLTEVLKVNTTAFAAYKKQGFKIRRELSCFQLKKENYKKTDTPYETEYVTKIEQEEWEQFELFWEFQPSWQNSIASIQAAPEPMIYALVRLDNNIIGYGVVDKNSGDIPQLAIHKGYRRKGIAGSIIAALLEKVEGNQLKILNVDDACECMISFLCQMGFEKTIGQYELVLPL